MKIEVYYKNGDQDIFDTDTLTESGSINQGTSNKAVMSKIHLSWGEFMKEECPSHLNLYAYYYRKNGDHGSSITNTKYLDEVLFYDNDRKQNSDISSDQIKQQSKDLPYGALEPGTWFTLIPIYKRKDILRIDIDGVTRIYRHHSYDELIDIFKFTCLESQYCTIDPENNSLEIRVNNLFNALLSRYTDDNGELVKDETDIAFEIGIPYILVETIQKNIDKFENFKKNS